MELSYFSALVLGLAGAGHCLGMCGGIAVALNMGAGGNHLPVTLAYHGGRITSYALLGALVGALTALPDYAAWTLFLRYLAGGMLIAMGLYIADWWRGLTWLERAGARLWRPVQQRMGRLQPGGRWTHGLWLGLSWGLMPCGLIYSSLAWAAAAASPMQSGLLMLVFGLGTLPVMLAASLGAGGLQAFLRRRGFKLAVAAMLIGFGAWTLYITYSHASHAGHPPAGAEMDHSQHH